jgi:hypothetical protein
MKEEHAGKRLAGAENEPRSPLQAEKTAPRLRSRLIRPPAGAKSTKRYVRERFVAALPKIADTLIENAEAGRVPEIKLLVELSGLEQKGTRAKPAKPRGKSFAEWLEEDWRKEPLDGVDGTSGQEE